MRDKIVLAPAVAEPVAAAPVVVAAGSVPPVAATVVPATPVAVAAAIPAITKTDSATASWATPAAAVKPDVVAAEPVKAAAVEPAKEFALKAPEGTTLEPATLEGYKTLSKDLGLTSEQAQKLYDRDLAAQKASQLSVTQEIQKQDAGWLTELKGKWGEKFNERSVTVSRAYDYADPDGSFRKGLREAGLINNPGLTEFVERFGDLFKEDKIPSGAGVVPAAKDTRPVHERLRDALSKETRKPKQ